MKFSEWAKLKGVAISGLSTREHTTMLPAFRNGDRVTVDVGLPDPQPGEIVAVSDEGLTVHLSGGTAGEGFLPLVWKCGNEYELLAGGRATVHRLM
jgi:hypothetical protein